MLEKIKLALQITGNVLDSELTDLMNASIIDLGLAGVVSELPTTDPILTRAVISYCAYQFELVHGDIQRANALKTVYDEHKAMLGMATGYTNWGV